MEICNKLMHFPAQFRSHSKVCTCVWGIPDRSQTAVTVTLRLVTQYRQITLNQTPKTSFKN
jgi:hypothetical protein